MAQAHSLRWPPSCGTPGCRSGPCARAQTLDRLEAAAIISACDPDIVAARINRADRRPQGWDLSLSLVRDDLGEAGARQTAGLGP
jgi:hypothetical protein